VINSILSHRASHYTEVEKALTGLPGDLAVVVDIKMEGMDGIE
jgi:CheY-like chemotaxis protein